MEDLSLVPAMKIIDNLSIEDVLNLKLVNKWFCKIINANVRIKHLVISTHDHVPYNRRWFYTCNLISPQHLIKYDYAVNVYIKLNQPFLSQLKQLYIKICKITLETLNSLDRLVHLEMLNCEIKSIAKKNVLRLPMLESLNLYFERFKLLIDSPKLKALKFTSGVDVELVHPESILHLEPYYYYQCKGFLRSCINLQHFYCQDFDSVDLDEFNLIKNLSKLKSIHFDVSRDVFNSLVEEKKRFNKDLKIYFLNLEFDEVPIELSKHIGKCLDQTIAKWYVEYYSKLADHCPFMKVVFYNSLEEFFVQIPEKFMNRFVNCYRFIVDKNVNDLDQLIRVLGDCKTITDLRLPSSLGQHFFDSKLYKLCPNIDLLEICGKEVLDCEFILNFKNISQLFFYQTESIEFVRRLVESHERIYARFNYYSYNRDLFEITIIKNREGYYKFYIRKGSEDSLVLDRLSDLYKLEAYCDNFKYYLMRK